MRPRVAVMLFAAACCYRTVDQVTIRGGDDSQQAALASAVEDTDRIWQSPAFWKLVEKHTWLAAPGAKPMTGADVHAALAAHRPLKQKYRLVAFYGFNVFTIFYSTATAQSSCGGSIDIRRGSVPFRTLVDTVAHENTHVVRNGTACPFSDGDYTAYDRPWLVSYGVGDMTECFRSSGGDEVRTEACFEQVVNAKHACRTFDRCCLKLEDPVPPYIDVARKGAEECRTSCKVLEAECEWHR